MPRPWSRSLLSLEGGQARGLTAAVPIRTHGEYLAGEEVPTALAEHTGTHEAIAGP